jgi:hypothetical protein
MTDRRLKLGAGTVLIAMLLACAVVSVHAQRGAVVGQPAAEITGGPWINSEPLSLAKLRGRVVLVEFWTYG